MQNAVILNSEGQPIVLNSREQKIAEYIQRIVNALGFEINVTTLTTVMKKISEQKFFHVPPADYLPVVVGEGSWSTVLQTYRSFRIGDDFATGVLNLGGNNARLASVSTGIDSVPVAVINWAKSMGWTIFELEQASKSGNWDVVTSLEESRKTNWDLGIQQVAFLGLKGSSSVLGLLNQAGITNDTTTLQGPISGLSPQDLKQFCTLVLNSYRKNAQRTVMPTHFIIPESDFLGLASPASASFPIKSTLAVLEETFQVMTNNKQFRILPLAYADKENSGLSYQVYTLLNYDEKSIRMNIPVDYTTTLANSLDNFSFQNVGYGQFTGVQAYRPKEMLYLTF